MSLLSSRAAHEAATRCVRRGDGMPRGASELAWPWPQRRSPRSQLGRLVDDVVAYVDSIEQPTGLAGWSGGAGLALAAVARSDAVAAVAPFEPLTPRMMDGHEQAALGDAVARMRELAAEGRSTDGLCAARG